MFYVASLYDMYSMFNIDNDVIRYIGEVFTAIEELEKMLEGVRKNEYVLDIGYVLDIKENLIWGKLCLGKIDNQNAKTEIESLTQGSNVTEKWKKEVRERYEFYDRFTQHADKVNLQI